jgi:hypothetical protein
MIYSSIEKYLKTSSYEFIIIDNTTSYFIHEPKLEKCIFEICFHNHPFIGLLRLITKLFKIMDSLGKGKKLPMDESSIFETPSKKSDITGDFEKMDISHESAEKIVITPSVPKRSREKHIDPKNILTGHRRTRSGQVNKPEDDGDEEPMKGPPTDSPGTNNNPPSKPAAQGDNYDLPISMKRYFDLATRTINNPHASDLDFQRVALIRECLKATGLWIENEQQEQKAPPSPYYQHGYGEEDGLLAEFEEKLNLHYLGKAEARPGQLANNKEYRKYIEGLYKLLNEKFSPDVVAHGSHELSRGRPDLAIIAIIKHFENMAESMHRMYMSLMEKYEWRGAQTLTEYIRVLNVLFYLVDRTGTIPLSDEYKMGKLETVLIARKDGNLRWFIEKAEMEGMSYQDMIERIKKFERKTIEVSALLKKSGKTEEKSKNNRKDGIVEKPFGVNYANENGKKKKSRGLNRANYKPQPPKQEGDNDGNEKKKDDSQKPRGDGNKSTKPFNKNDRPYPNNRNNGGNQFRNPRPEQKKNQVNFAEEEEATDSERYDLAQDNYEYEEYEEEDEEYTSGKESLFTQSLVCGIALIEPASDAPISIAEAAISVGLPDEPVRGEGSEGEPEGISEEGSTAWQTLDELTQASEDEICEEEYQEIYGTRPNSWTSYGQYCLDRESERKDEFERRIGDTFMADEESIEQSIEDIFERREEVSLLGYANEPYMERRIILPAQLQQRINVTCFKLETEFLEFPQPVIQLLISYIESFGINGITDGMYDYQGDDQFYLTAHEIQVEDIPNAQFHHLVRHSEDIRTFIMNGTLPAQMKHKVDQCMFRLYQLFVLGYVHHVRNFEGLGGVYALFRDYTSLQQLQLANATGCDTIITAKAWMRSFQKENESKNPQDYFFMAIKETGSVRSNSPSEGAEAKSVSGDDWTLMSVAEESPVDSASVSEECIDQDSSNQETEETISGNKRPLSAHTECISPNPETGRQRKGTPFPYPCPAAEPKQTHRASFSCRKSTGGSRKFPRWTSPDSECGSDCEL